MVKKMVGELAMPAMTEEPEEPRVVIHLWPGRFISGIPMRDLTASEWMGLKPSLRWLAKRAGLYEVPDDLMEEDKRRMTNE